MMKTECTSKVIIVIFVTVKEIIQKFVAIAMALLVLASTTSWKVEKHFCMGHLIDLTFFLEAEGCGMAANLMDDKEAFQIDDSCCSDEVVFMDGQDDIKPASDSLDNELQPILIAFTYSYFYIFNEGNTNESLIDDYPPPILVKNIQLLDQVFLI